MNCTYSSEIIDRDIEIMDILEICGEFKNGKNSIVVSGFGPKENLYLWITTDEKFIVSSCVPINIEVRLKYTNEYGCDDFDEVINVFMKTRGDLKRALENIWEFNDVEYLSMNYG